MKRRDFLKTSFLATSALVSAPLAADAKKEKLMIKAYRPLGKTGLKISDISLGTGRLSSPSIVLRAIDRGINYMDTAPDYGPAEKYIGNAMKKIQRDKIIIATKFCTPYPYPSHLKVGSKKKDYISSVEGSLKRMKTDYVDFCFVHAIGEASSSLKEERDRLINDELLAAVDELKASGKMRFLGVSSHGPNNMETLMMDAVSSGHYDLIMPSFNFMKFPKLPNMMKEAKKRGVAVVAMKTLAGAKEMDIDRGGQPFETAAFKWVLSHPEVNGLVITIKSIADFDRFLPASGETFSAADKRTLDKYADRFATEYCRTGCSQCEASCPNGVAIASTLRYQMYFKDYGMEKEALQKYAKLEAKAEACAECISVDCSGSCPYGLPVDAMLREAHDALTFIV